MRRRTVLLLVDSGMTGGASELVDGLLTVEEGGSFLERPTLGLDDV